MLRFAPSPTGDMHLGNLRVALYNYIVSRQTGEGFTIRIEDTDKERNIPGKDKEILELLALFGFHYDHLMYQSENIKKHQLFALQLIGSKRAFNCFCTPETLEAKRQASIENKIAYRYDGACENLPAEAVIDNKTPFVVRIKKPLTSITFTDKIKGTITFEPDDIDSFIILRQDKNPTYNFACAVDDMLSDISLVIRGEDHISNTPKQMAIRAALGYTKTMEYAHLPIILNDEGKKMSKRDDASSVKWLLEEGFIPSAIINYLVTLGNSTPKEIFTLDEAIEWFDLSKISKAPARFDIQKLRFVNREHLKMLDDEELSRYVGFIDANIGKAAKLFLEETSTTKELREKFTLMFAQKEAEGEYGEVIATFKTLLKKAPYFESFDELKNYLTQESGIKGKPMFKGLRLLLTGQEHGVDLTQLYSYIKTYLQEIIR
ncbi:MAG: glutamylglutaminyl-tRNA ligase [Sulfuricurvum sp. PC08-66]|nr:MAG: glutamylglutaminyl-tRNA ligase [Sulfuricurvum sp. PC08-66]